MHPPPRKTRTTNTPGLVDLPKSRRRTADVTAEKQKKKEIAAAKAKAKEAKLAQVARVEKEIRVAQEETTPTFGQAGKRGQAKRTFERETPANKKVSSSGLPPEWSPHTAHRTLTASQPWTEA